MSLEHVTDHEARGAARLTEQFKYQPAVVALLKSWLADVQEVEDAAFELQLARAVDSAEGTALDVVGALVGQGREGRSDTQYRIWIKGKVLVNRSRGRPHQLIAIAAKLAKGTVEFVEYYPAAFTIWATEPVLGSDGVEIAKLLQLARAGGVTGHFSWFDDDQSFAFSDSGELVENNALGFGQGRMAAVSDGRDMVFEPDVVIPPSDGSGAILVVVL